MKCPQYYKCLQLDIYNMYIYKLIWFYIHGYMNKCNIMHLSYMMKFQACYDAK
jgi:hypothetical protein